MMDLVSETTFPLAVEVINRLNHALALSLKTTEEMFSATGNLRRKELNGSFEAKL
jgi:hypothetical protein